MLSSEPPDEQLGLEPGQLEHDDVPEHGRPRAAADTDLPAQRHAAASRAITARTSTAAAAPTAVKPTPPRSGIDDAARTSAPAATATSMTTASVSARASIAVDPARPSSGSSE